MIRTTASLLTASLVLASAPSALADNLGDFSGAGAKDFNSPIFFNNTNGTPNNLPTAGTAPNDINLAGGSPKTYTLDDDITFGGAVNANLIYNSANHEVILEDGAAADFNLINIGTNDGGSAFTVNGGTVDFTRFVTNTTQQVAVAFNGGTITASSIANGGAQFVNDLDFDLTGADVTISDNFNIGSAPDVDFTIGDTFNVINAGSAFTVLNQAATDVTLASDPGFMDGDMITLISSSNAGNNVQNNSTPQAFLGGFGGTYTLNVANGGDIVLNIVTGTDGGPVIPEPASLALLGLGGLALLGRGRRNA